MSIAALIHVPAIDHSNTIIRVNNVSFHYGVHEVLCNVSFDIHKGNYLGIIGPNGGGKTTLLKIMLGLLKPSLGAVTLFGTDVRKFKNWHAIGYVPQKAVQFDAQFPATVAEVVAMGLFRRRGLGMRPSSADNKKIDEALALVDMAAHKQNRIGDLSSGQQQRVFIARALAGGPEVIFLDEPTVGVDPPSQEQFYSLLKKMNEELGLTLILVSHDIDVVARAATEIACLNGRLLSYGPPKEFHADASLKELYGKDMKFIAHDHPI